MGILPDLQQWLEIWLHSNIYLYTITKNAFFGTTFMYILFQSSMLWSWQILIGFFFKSLELMPFEIFGLI